MSGFTASSAGFILAALIFYPERAGGCLVSWKAGIVLVVRAAIAFGMSAYVALSGRVMSGADSTG